MVTPMLPMTIGTVTMASPPREWPTQRRLRTVRPQYPLIYAVQVGVPETTAGSG
jgi:hypothetical protein